MKDYFTIIAISSDDSIIYISNTSPILWSSDRNKVKKFISYKNAKSELEDNFISLSATIKYSKIKSIHICEYIDNIEVGRERLL